MSKCQKCKKEYPTRPWYMEVFDSKYEFLCEKCLNSINQPERSKGDDDDPICFCEKLGVPRIHRISFHRFGVLNTQVTD